MLIKLENITKLYKTDLGSEYIVFENLNFEINKGELLSVVGPSGCGKTTLLNIIGTMDRPDKGVYLFGEENVLKMNEKQTAELRNKKIGFIFQSHHLLPQLNLFDNVMLPILAQNNNNSYKEAKKRALELIDFVGLSEKIEQRPGQLSGGESQRTAVVRALINQPDILLADEPTGSLDGKMAEQVADLLMKINIELGVAMLIVTHSTKLAEKTNTKYVLENKVLSKK